MTMVATAAAAMTLTELKSLLSADSYSLKAGVFTVRRGFFYRNGGSAEAYAARVVAAVPGATVLDCGEVWKAFKGGASVANHSHWYVNFTVAR